MTTTARGKAKKRARTTPATRRTRKPTGKKKAARDQAGPAFQRPLWMGLGAVAMARDAAGEFLDDAIERGEELEARARKRSGRTTAKRAKPAKSAKSAKAARAKKAPARATRKKATNTWFDLSGNGFADRVRAVFDLPTKKDLKTLEKKIDALAKKTTRASRARARRRATPVATAPPGGGGPALEDAEPSMDGTPFPERP